MTSKIPTGKASKGSVQIHISNSRLQLQFRCAGKRHYISLGLTDTSTNRKVAEMKAREIELDMLSGHFDETLTRYKPQTTVVTANSKAVPSEPKSFLTPSELWERHNDSRAAELKETTKQYHRTLGKLFIRLGEVPVTEALHVKVELGKITTVHQTKRCLGQLSTACEWAKKHGFMDSNPYDGMSCVFAQLRHPILRNFGTLFSETSAPYSQKLRHPDSIFFGTGFSSCSAGLTIG
jgi:integrase